MFIMLTNAGKEINNSRSGPSGPFGPSRLSVSFDNPVDLLETLQTSLMEDMCAEGFDLSLFDNCNPILDCNPILNCNSILDCNPILDLGKCICYINVNIFCRLADRMYAIF